MIEKLKLKNLNTMVRPLPPSCFIYKREVRDREREKKNNEKNQN
jgi:hypothetical protein